MQRAVVIVQEHGAGQSPYFVLRDQPQRINAMTSFNDRVTTVCLKVCKQLGTISFIIAYLVLFITCEVNHVGVIDTNQNFATKKLEAPVF